MRRTDPRSIAVGSIGALVRGILPAGAILFASASEAGRSLWIPLAVLAALGIAGFVSTWLAWYRRTYRVGTADIRVESGILSRAARSVPFERIQDVSLEQGFVPRLFGLVEVRFETGAGGGDDLKLAYLPEVEAERLRDTVRDRREAAAGEDAAVADPRKETDGEALFAMDLKRLLTFGLFEFSLAVVAVVFAAVQQFDFLLPFDPWERETWARFAGVSEAWVVSLGPMAQVVGAMVAIAGLLLLGVVTGLARTVLRDWDFTLLRTPKGFRRRRGLLTKTDVVMPIHRVQALRIGTGIVRRLLGWHSLKFVSLAQDSGAANHTAVPFGQLGEIWPVARIAGFAEPDAETDWHRAHRRYRTDQAVLAALVLAVPAGIALLTPYPALALVPLALGALLALRSAFLWRYEEHALAGHQVLSRTGWLAPKLSVATQVKLHSVEIARGPLGRVRGYVTLHLGLAGGKFAIAGIDPRRAKEIRRTLLARMTATDFSALPG